MAITLRAVTGSALSHNQLDTNFSSLFYSASVSASILNLHYTGSATIGLLPRSTSINLPSSSKWSDIAGGGISRNSVVQISGSTGISGSVNIFGNLTQGFSGLQAYNFSHAEGYFTIASGSYSHAEGYQTATSGNYSHAEGRETSTAILGQYSHAEGYQTITSGSYSHAEGQNTIARGLASHAEGLGTVALGNYQHVQGQYNLSSSIESAFIVGNGASDGSRSNLLFAAGDTVQVTGSVIATQGFTGSLFGTASYSIATATNAATASYALTASHAPLYLPLTGGTINGNIVVNGTASIGFLDVRIESASVIYSSGSNQLGDATNDTQTLIGTVIVSGSQRITGSLNVSQGITGSLFGTASFATSASWAPLNAGGNNTQIQYNSGSALAGTASFTFDYLKESLQQGLNISATGVYSHAEGHSTQAQGPWSHTEGRSTVALTTGSHAEGLSTQARGIYSHAEGQETIASGSYSHAEGSGSIARGYASHAEGELTRAIGYASHAEGLQTTASGDYSHAEGWLTQATQTYSHAEGRDTQASGFNSHAEGRGTQTLGAASHAEGYFTIASGNNSHAEGNDTETLGQYSHAEGTSTQAVGEASHAEGYYTRASGEYSHAEGAYTNGTKNYSHVEGYYNAAAGLFSHAEGLGTVAAGTGSKAEGIGAPAYDPSSPFENIFDAFGLTIRDASDNDLINIDTPITSLTTLTATGNFTSTVTYPYRVPYVLVNYSYYAQPYTLVLESATYSSGTGLTTFTVSGLPQYFQTAVSDSTAYTLALGDYSHAEGESTKTYGKASHAEGYYTIASGSWAHAEGWQTEAIGTASHAEGYQTKAIGIASHAEGTGTQAIGNYSHAEGVGTVASGSYQHVQGQFNISSSAQSAFIIGNGTADGSRSNLVFASGNTFQVTGSLRVSGSITGSLFGTASFATTASYVLGGGTGPISVLGSTLYSTSPAAGPNFNTTGSIFLGTGSGYLATNAERSNFLGVAAGRQATSASYSNFIGNEAGFGAIGASYSNFIGNFTGWQALNASGSIFIGNGAGFNAASASYTTLIGYAAGNNGNSIGNGIGSNNIIIGTNINLPAGTKDSINLGGIIFATGSHSDTTSSFAFSGSMPNARVGIGTSTPAYTLDVSGSGRFTNDLQVTGSLNISYDTIVGNGINVRGHYPLLTLTNSGSSATNGGGIITVLDRNILTKSPNIGILTISAADGSGTAYGSIEFTKAASSVSNIILTTNPILGPSVYISGSRNVGIGTSTPAYTLDVSGSTRINDILLLQPRTTTPTPVEGMVIASGSAGASILYYYNGTSWNALF